MNVNCAIHAKLWNSLGRNKQFALRDGLRFMGHRALDIHFPEEKIPLKYTIVMDKIGDLFPAYFQCIDESSLNFMTLEDIDSFIELTCGNCT